RRRRRPAPDAREPRSHLPVGPAAELGDTARLPPALQPATRAAGRPGRAPGEARHTRRSAHREASPREGEAGEAGATVGTLPVQLLPAPAAPRADEAARALSIRDAPMRVPPVEMFRTSTASV